MRRLIFSFLLALLCSYSTAVAQDTKRDTTSLGDHYDQLGRDIKSTSKATWKETKKASGKAWQKTKDATSDALDKVGDWSKKSSKKIKEKE